MFRSSGGINDGEKKSGAYLGPFPKSLVEHFINIFSS